MDEETDYFAQFQGEAERILGAGVPADPVVN